MARVVGARAGDDGRAVADGVERRREELELLVVGERRALPRRACDDDAVGAVVDEMHRELPELVEVDRAVAVERRDDRGQDFAEHGESLRHTGCVLLPAADASPADWVVERWSDEGGELTPRGFRACARVCHPARLGGGFVSWSEVAAKMGTVAHPRMDFDWIAQQPYGDRQERPGIYDTGPEEGWLPDWTVGHVAQVLSRHTSTPERCWFGIWEGNGDPCDAAHSGATFSVPWRRYHLFAGTIRDAAGLWEIRPRPSFWTPDHWGPAVWWPDDHAWFVGSDTDLGSTYIAGTEALVADLVAAPYLESYEVPPVTGFAERRDEINPEPPDDRKNIGIN